MEKNIISIIIVNYNSYRITKQCVDSINKTKGCKIVEIIVVDNGSADESFRKLVKIHKKQKNLLVIRKKKNNMLAPAYNKGFKCSKGNIVIFMNNDLLFTSGWLDAIIKTLSNKNVGVVGAAMFKNSHRKIVDNLGGSLNILGFGRQIRAFGKNPFYIQGALMAFYRNVFKELGGFDNSYKTYYEDVDICWRARLLGYKIQTAEKSVIYHIGSLTVNKFLERRKSAYLCRRNRLITILKNEGFFLLIISMFLNVLVSILLFVKESILNKDIKLAIQTPKAFLYIVRNYSSLYLKRKFVQKTRRISDIKVLKSMLNLNN